MAWAHYRGLIEVADKAQREALAREACEILKVIDGDTLTAKIFLQPGHWVKEKLRLRDLDCREIGTPAGRAARDFTVGLLAAAREITIATTKPDKYDRYPRSSGS